MGSNGFFYPLAQVLCIASPSSHSLPPTPFFLKVLFLSCRISSHPHRLDISFHSRVRVLRAVLGRRLFLHLGPCVGIRLLPLFESSSRGDQMSGQSVESHEIHCFELKDYTSIGVHKLLGPDRFALAHVAVGCGLELTTASTTNSTSTHLSSPIHSVSRSPQVCHRSLTVLVFQV
jgi:hypothetical protein